MSLRLKPRPSRIFSIIMIVIHAGAASLLFTVFPIWVAILLASIVLIHFIHVMNQHVLLRSPGSIKELVWMEPDNWTLQTQDNKQYDLILLSSSYCHPKLVVLNFQSEHKKHSIVLTVDSLSKDIFRRLRVRLTIERSRAVINPAASFK